MTNLKCIIIISIGIVLTSKAAFAYEKPVRGLWVPCEGTYRALESKDKIDRLLAISQQIGISDLFIQIYRGNRAWYPSKLVDDTPYRNIFNKTSFDTFNYLLKQAHKKNIKIHAWCNIFRIARNNKAVILEKMGTSSITKDNRGRSLLSYNNFKIPLPERNYYENTIDGIWLEQGNPDVQSFLLEVLKEILVIYPDIDGIHLDYVRYPFLTPVKLGSRFSHGIDFGYGEKSIERFGIKKGFNPLVMSHLNRQQAQIWDNWRRKQITEFIEKAYKATKSHNKNLSAAVIGWKDIAYNGAFQNWMDWIDRGIIDFVIPMIYTTDLSAFKYLTESTVSLNRKSSVFLGIGAYLFDPELMTDFSLFFAYLNRVKPEGIVLFSFDSIIENKQQLEFLKEVIQK
ncbi:glycoside hydrolase family 10 protein [Chlamydiota bacterium]